jgi:hypothetical protein
MNGFLHVDNLLSLLLNFALEYTNRKVQVDQNGLKLKARLHLVYVDDVNILGESILIIEKNRRFWRH